MKTIVLIEAGDSEIGGVFIAHSREELVTIVNATFPEYVERIDETRSTSLCDEAHDSLIRQDNKKRKAIIKMIEMHENWSPGRYDLAEIDPYNFPWRLVNFPWRLVITEGRYGSAN